MSEREKVEGIVLIYAPTEAYLNTRQEVAYRSHREKLIKWLARRCSDTDKAVRLVSGLCSKSPAPTVRATASS